MKTVLVLGAGGFLGRHVVAEFDRAGWQVAADLSPRAEDPGFPARVRCRTGRLPDPDWGLWVEAVAPGLIVHAAGPSSVQASLLDPGADFNSQVTVTARILEQAARHAPGCRVIFLSSAAVYGQPVALPLTESSPLSPCSPYGTHKRMVEQLLEQAARFQELQAVSLRIFSAYGPGLRRQVVWEACRQAVRDGEIVLDGTGGETRDFLHAADVARAVRCTAENPFPRDGVILVASGREVSIQELAEQVARTAGTPPPRFRGNPRPGDPARWSADIQRLRALGFTPEVGLEDGIDGVLRWVRAEAEAGR